MKKRFRDEQIIQMIKEQDAGERAADVFRRHGISKGMFHKHKSNYGGVEPSAAAYSEVQRHAEFAHAQSFSAVAQIPPYRKLL